MHRAHEELTKRAAQQIGGGLLIHPVVGVTKPGDVDHFTRVRCYRALVDNYYEPGSVVLSLLPLAMRMAGPREVLLHAIIRRNHGCTHFVVGRDHAGPGSDSTGKPFYPPHAAQEAMDRHQDEIGMEMVDFKQMVYLPDEDRYCPVDEVPDGARTADIWGTQVRENYLAKGQRLPEWFNRPVVAEILNETNPPRFRQGVTIWFTGLSGSGKSTIAQCARRAAGRVRPQRLLPGRRRDPDPPVEGPRLQQGGPRREHQPRRLRRRPGRPAWRHHPLLGHQPLPRAARQRQEVFQGELRRGLLRHPDRGLRAARRQGPLRQGPRRPDQGLHGRRRPVRATAEPRGDARHQHALGPGVRPSDHRQAAGVGLHPASGSHLMKPIRNWHQSGVRRPPEQLGIIRVTLPLGGLALGMVAAAGTCPPVCADERCASPRPAADSCRRAPEPHPTRNVSDRRVTGGRDRSTPRRAVRRRARVTGGRRS